MQYMKDPAAGIPPQLLPHMHLVSKYRYPIISAMSLETVVGYLTEAQKIVHDLQPVQWQFLDAPQDGSLLLVWQPLEHLDTNFASDGYVWGDVEQAFSQEIRGYTLEMWLHRSGYKHPGEPMACHSRRRYRLLPSKMANTGVAPPDPSLWIVHYQKAERRDCIPAQSIQIIPQVNMILQQRRLLQSYGQLARKEFMLHDRSNWPTITLPAAPAGIAHAQAFAGNLARQQQANLMAGQQPASLMGQMGASRASQMAHVRGRSTNLLAGDITVEEEEDVSRGDMLDFISPREISKMRYEQHHEWMEEIMSSPYASKQIVPTDLGLGRKGELETLTSGFFEAPTTVMQETSGNTPGRVGRLAPNKAEEFTQMAAKKVSDMQADLENMKRKHAKRMAKLRKTTVLNSAERRLRTAPNMSDAPATRDVGDSNTDNSASSSNDTVEDIVQEVEGAWGRKIEPLANVICIQRGGLEQRTGTNSANVRQSANGIESPTKNPNVREEIQPTSDQGTIPAIVEEEEPKPVLSSPSSEVPNIPGGTPTVENDGGIINSAVDSAPEDGDLNDSAVPPPEDMDVNMETAEMEEEEQGLRDESGVGSEWVMVGDETGNSNTPADQTTQQQASPISQERDSTTTPAAYLSTSGNGDHSLPASDPDASPIQLPEENPDLDSKEFGPQGDFDDIDVNTAGDALVDYGDENEDIGLDVMDDSAFGDAFHPPDDPNTMDNAEY